MPSVFVPVPPFPSVPNLPGVPQLTRNPIGIAAAVLPSIIANLKVPAPVGVLPHPASPTPVWGIFDSTGSQVIDPDSILDFGYRAEYRVSDYPIQEGQFASYNKVRVPSEIAIRMIKGSDIDSRTTFEAACERVNDSFAQYTIVTPEKSYVGMNSIRLDFTRRERHGAFQIEAEMYFRKIIETTPQYSSTSAAAASTANAQQPGSQPVNNSGLVQPLAIPQNTEELVNLLLHDDMFATIGKGVAVQ